MTPDSPAWARAKAQGDRAELAVAAWFKGRGFEPYKSLGYADVDLLLQCFVEVKNDLKALKTGNVAIETAYRTQASGIMTSPANYWAIVVGDEAIIIETAKLREFAVRDIFPEVQAGDGHASRIRLVPFVKLKSLKGVRVIPLAGPTR
jgi:hypothetical protein